MYAPYLFFFLFVASGFGGGLLVLSRWMERREGPDTLPSDHGREAGLTPEGPHDAFGERDDITVHARWTSVRRGLGSSSRVVSIMRYRAMLDPPLRMGLELDRALRVRAIDDAHAAAVLGDPEVQLALLAGSERGDLHVSDTEVVITHDGWADSPDAVGEGIDTVHRIARALLDSRARALADWEVALDDAWGEIARAGAMEWQPERSRLVTRANDAWLSLEVVAERGELVTQLTLRFDAPLGLTIQRKDAEDHGADAIVRLAARMPELDVDDRGATARARELLSDPHAAADVMRAGRDLARALRGGGASGRIGAYR